MKNDRRMNETGPARAQFLGVETVQAWMELFENRPSVPYYAAVAAHGALIFALLGRVLQPLPGA